MSIPETATAVRPNRSPFIRDATRADYPAIRYVVIAANLQYAGLVPPGFLAPYLADLVDVEEHARHGRLLVAEIDGQVRGFAAFYPDVSAQNFGLPRGWAGGRALAVHPDARGRGVARAFLARAERLAREAGAPVFAFHTASFMTSVITLYEELGFRRAPEFDFDLAARYGHAGSAPITSLTYLRHLTDLPAVLFAHLEKSHEH